MRQLLTARLEVEAAIEKAMTSELHLAAQRVRPMDVAYGPSMGSCSAKASVKLTSGKRRGREMSN